MATHGVGKIYPLFHFSCKICPELPSRPSQLFSPLLSPSFSHNPRSHIGKSLIFFTLCFYIFLNLYYNRGAPFNNIVPIWRSTSGNSLMELAWERFFQENFPTFSIHFQDEVKLVFDSFARKACNKYTCFPLLKFTTSARSSLR